MAAIAVQPIVLTDSTLKIAADNYEAHVSTVELVPTTSLVNFKGLTATANFTFPTSSSWQANLSYAQDWETANSLSQYLFDHEGESVEMEFYPKAGGTGWSITAIIVPGTIGGAVDSVAVGTVTLGIQGKPSRIVVIP